MGGKTPEGVPNCEKGPFATKDEDDKKEGFLPRRNRCEKDLSERVVAQGEKLPAARTRKKGGTYARVNIEKADHVYPNENRGESDFSIIIANKKGQEKEHWGKDYCRWERTGLGAKNRLGRDICRSE